MTDHTKLENSFFLKQFHEFYGEVIIQKKAITAFGKRRSMAGGAEDLLIRRESAHPVCEKLMSLLELQVLEAKRQGGEYGVAFYKEVQYVMAALADDIFLHLEWEGRDEWKSNLLEFRLFGTYTAGEVFFRKVESILKDRDPSYREVAMIYFLAISLGFRGKFRDKADDDQQIGAYRERLFAFVFGKDADLSDESRKLFPESYPDKISGQEEGEKLPYLKKWIALIAILVIVFLFVSYVVWNHSTRDMIRITEEILR